MTLRLGRTSPFLALGAVLLLPQPGCGGPSDTGGGPSADTDTDTDTDADTDADTDTDSDTDSDADSDADADTDTGVPAGLSFADDIYPVAEADCLDCHHDWGSSAGALYGTWTTQLEQGMLLVTAGQPAQSYVYLKVSSDAPPHGARMPLQVPYVSDTDLAALRAWITAGAPNDATFRVSMGKIFDAYACDDCHADWAARNDLAALYTKVTTASAGSMPYVDPGNPDGSYLYLKLTDAPPDGERMPRQVAPWSVEAIARLEQWIAEGALNN